MFKTIKDVPQVGFGLWKIPPEETVDTVIEAIKAGYRHFDSACDYGNEKAVGEGFKAAIEAGLCTREDLWVTSKLWNTYHAPEHVELATRKSLKDLGLEYLDLYLIHFPISLKFVPFEKRYPPEWIHDPEASSPRMEFDNTPLHKTWEAMERLVDLGLVKNIGVCNYNTALIHDLMRYARIKPAMLQVEIHPYLTQEKLLQTCLNYDIGVTGFSPLGSLSYLSLNMADKNESVLEQDCVLKAAETHGRTAAQIVLRWAVQRGIAVIPKSTNPLRMRENIAIFDFELTSEEMQSISNLNRNRRFNDPGVFCKDAFNTFHAIYD